MRKALGEINLVGLLRADSYAPMLAECWRARSQVQRDIHNLPGDAKDQFRLIIGRQLKVETSQDFAPGNRIVVFAELGLKPVGFKERLVKGLDERATGVRLHLRSHLDKSRDSSLT